MSQRLDASRDATAVGPVWRQLRHRFREGRYDIPAENWRRWGTIIIGGIAAMFVLMVLLMLAVRYLLEAGHLHWESAFLQSLERGGPFRFSSAVFFQTFGSDITLVILVGAAAGVAVWMRRPITGLSIVLAPLIPDLIGRFGWAIWHRARPDVLYDGFASPGFHSFPSGHTSKTTATYGFLALLWIAASRSWPERAAVVLLLLFILVVVPFGRMGMGVHWPSDVLGGFVIGAAWLAVLAWGRRCERSGYTASSRAAAGSPDSTARVAR